MARDWRKYVAEQQKQRREKFLSGFDDDRFVGEPDTTISALDPRGGYADLTFTAAKRRGRMTAPNMYDITPEEYNRMTASYDVGYKPHEVDKNLRQNRFRYHSNLHNRKGLNKYLLDHPHLKGYVGDVDGDKIPDYVVTDSDGAMLYYNGYNMPNPKLWQKTQDKMTYMKAIMSVIKLATSLLKDNPDYIAQTQALKAAGQRRNIGAIAGIIARHLIMRMLPNRYFTALAEAKRKQAENIGVPVDQLHESAKLTKFEKYMVGAWTAINKDPAIRRTFIDLVYLAFGISEIDTKGDIAGYDGGGAAIQSLTRTILTGDGTSLARTMEGIANSADVKTNFTDYVVKRFHEELQAYGTREERRDRAKRKKIKEGYVAPVAHEYVPYYGAQPKPVAMAPVAHGYVPYKRAQPVEEEEGGYDQYDFKLPE